MAVAPRSPTPKIWFFDPTSASPEHAETACPGFDSGWKAVSQDHAPTSISHDTPTARPTEALRAQSERKRRNYGDSRAPSFSGPRSGPSSWRAVGATPRGCPPVRRHARQRAATRAALTNTKIPSRDAPAPELCLIRLLPIEKIEGSEAPKGAILLGPRHIGKRHRLPMRGARKRAKSRGALAFRRSTAALRRLLGSSPGRASWNYRVQTGGPSPAPVQRAPRGPVIVPAGTMPEVARVRGYEPRPREPISLRFRIVSRNAPR
jgi:hypothetical protein